MDIKQFAKLFSKMEQDSKYEQLLRHLERTSMLCYAVGKELKLYPEECEVLYFAGVLHEVGKVGFNEEIKVDEKAINIDDISMFLTVSMLGNMDDFEDVSRVISKYKENCDGTGYPNKLDGTEMGLGAIILKICDYYDHQRMAGVSHDDTCKLLRKNSDVLFPRRIITPFIKSVIDNELQNEYSE